MNIRNLIFLAMFFFVVYVNAAENFNFVKVISTKEQFQKEVIECAKPTIVKFFATWCPPCSRMKPVLNNIANSFKDRINVFEINIDNANVKEIADQKNVKGIPTVIFFLNGQEKTRTVGFKTETQLKGIIKQLYNLQ